MFYSDWGNILSLDFFHVVKLLMPIFSLLPIFSICKKLANIFDKRTIPENCAKSHSTTALS